MASTTRALDDVAAGGGDLWLVLWQSLGDIWLWAGVSSEERQELFGPATAEVRNRVQRIRREVPELTEALGTLHLLHTAPQIASGAQLAHACQQVSRWAEAESLLDLAAYYAEGAAVALPGDPARANEAARLCRRAALNTRAAAWYERAFKLAVRVQNRREIVGALLGYGSLLYGLGYYARARPYFERVARFAARTGRRRTAGEAHHDLMAVSADEGDLRQAAEHARLAESFYPRHHPRLPFLVHDCAVLLVHLHHYTAALPPLRRLPPYFPRPESGRWCGLPSPARRVALRNPC